MGDSNSNCRICNRRSIDDLATSRCALFVDEVFNSSDTGIPGSSDSIVDTDRPAVEVDAALVLEVDAVSVRLGILVRTGICFFSRLTAEPCCSVLFLAFVLSVSCLCDCLFSNEEILTDVLGGAGGRERLVFLCDR